MINNMNESIGCDIDYHQEFDDYNKNWQQNETRVHNEDCPFFRNKLLVELCWCEDNIS